MRRTGGHPRHRAGGLLLAAAACALSPALASARPAEVQPLRSLVRDTFRDRDGLPQNAIRALLQSSAGPLWIATDEGLARYDGATFTTVSRRDEPGLTSDIISALAETPDGTLWIGTYDGGVVRRRDGRFEPVAIRGAPPGLRVHRLVPAHDGGLWVASASGAYRLTEGRTVALTMANGLPDDRVSAIAVDRDGATWFSTRRGLARLVGDRLLPGPAELRGVATSDLAPDPAGGVWVGTSDRGVAHVDADGVRFLGAKDGLPSPTVAALAVDRQGSLWVGTQTAGLARVRGGAVERLGARDGMAGDWVSVLHEDREGSLWVGTQDAGLMRLREADLTTLGRPEGLSHDSIESLLEARNGDLWIATDGGVDRLPRGALPARREVACAPMSLHQDRRGAIWIGTIGQGLWRWRDGAVDRLQRGLPAHAWIRAIAEDAEGTLWAATTEGLYRVRADRLEPVDEGLPAERPPVVALVVTPLGELFVATEGGGVFRRGGGRFVREVAGPPEAWVVSAFLADVDGTVWLATEGGGLWRRQLGRYARVSASQGLVSDTLWAIVDDGLGALWISTNRGVFRAARADLDAVMAGKADRLQVRSWGMDEGMRSQEAAGLSHPGGLRAADGRVWFATLRGASVFDPGRLRPEPAAPGVGLQRVSVSGQPQPTGAELVLPPGGGRFQAEFGALVLLGQRSAVFRHRLTGLDEAWSEPSRSRLAQFTNLPPGRFRFEVQARLGDGPWGPATSLAVRQLPPPWRSPEVLVAGLALALASGTAGAVAWRRAARARRRGQARALEAAQAEVAALSALLPRCGWCHEPRRDPAYLAEVEAFMRARPATRFDEGLCPSCAARRRPDDPGSGKPAGHPTRPA